MRPDRSPQRWPGWPRPSLAGIALASSPVAKAVVRTEIVQTRLQEAESLAARGELDSTKEQEIQDRVNEHVAELQGDLAVVEKDSPDQARDINNTIEASMHAHTRIIETIAVARGESARIMNVPAGKVTSTPAAATALMIVDPTTSSVTAGVSADDSVVSAIEEATKALPPGQAKKVSADYEKRKQEVQSFIQSAVDHLNDISKDQPASNGPSVQESIVNEARTQIDRAQEKIVEADTLGNEADAYSVLNQSERSAKEAQIYLKAQGRIGNEIRSAELRAPAERTNNSQGGSVNDAVDSINRSNGNRNSGGASNSGNSNKPGKWNDKVK